MDQSLRRIPRDSTTRIDAALGEAADGLTMRELVTATKLHENAVRRTLARLTASGAVHVESRRSGSIGRPTLRYRRAGGPDEPFKQFLPLLLELVDSAHAPDTAAYAIGRAHGTAAAAASTASTARDAVFSSMVKLGFQPRQEDADQAGETAFALDCCPFTDAVTSTPGGRRICALHHGFVAGVAEARNGTLGTFVINDPRVAPCRVSVSATRR
jgi:predicted ArsR family transcriptional regulator